MESAHKERRRTKVTPEAPAKGHKKTTHGRRPLAGARLSAAIPVQGRKPKLADSPETARRSRVNGMSGLVAQYVVILLEYRQIGAIPTKYRLT